jgi:type I restriction enzyme S subunit
MVRQVAGSGADFQVNDGERTVFVEATVPAPEGLPAEWLQPRDGVYSLPDEDMVLRWTSAIRDKAGKHLADIDKRHAMKDSPFVIALNSCRLSRRPEDHGISQWLFAVAAVFPVGPPVVPIDRRSGEAGPMIQSLRRRIRRRANVEVPTGVFLDERYAHVSALIGCSSCYADEDARKKFHGFPPMIFVRNPLARNPLPRGWLPGAIEYWAEQIESEHFHIRGGPSLP